MLRTLWVLALAGRPSLGLCGTHMDLRFLFTLSAAWPPWLGQSSQSRVQHGNGAVRSREALEPMMVLLLRPQLRCSLIRSSSSAVDKAALLLQPSTEELTEYVLVQRWHQELRSCCDLGG